MATKNPDLTRSKLLEAGFEEVYEHGFRSASIDSILAKAGVTKGALYHHFPSKVALGYALVDEVIGHYMLDRMLTPLATTDDPITALQQHGINMLETNCENTCSRGCPLNNLAQEMSGEDEEFRRRIQAVYRDLENGIADALRRGQQAGTVRADADANDVAAYFVAAMSGIIGAAKGSQDEQLMRRLVLTGNEFLDTYRPTAVH